VHVQVHEADLFQDSQGDPPSAIVIVVTQSRLGFSPSQKNAGRPRRALQREAAPN
jgi:hypothetical protein